MVTLRLLPMGQDALLAEVATLDADSATDPAGAHAGATDSALALALAAQAARASGDPIWAEVTDIVPGACTVLVRVATSAALPGIGSALRGLAAALGPASGIPSLGQVTVPVVYDGPDLDEVARLTGLGRAGVVAAHTGTPWRVGFGGFAPGFAYLVGGDPRLQVPRRPAPRARVPAGAVGLAGRFSGIYPRASPGGWQLLGTTPITLWDKAADPPALLRPGVVVRFVDAGAGG